MQQTHVTRRVTASILSMSLLTVMAGAAIAPALGIIKNHFATAPELLVQLIVSMPALMIIVTNVFFFGISRRFGSKAIATAGLLLYVASGAGCFFVDDINALLLMRALLGVSVGLIMPLSTGLLAYYFPPEQQAHLMGLSAAMNQMGGVVATLLAGMLAMVQWNYAFLVYLLGLIAVVMVWAWLPNARLGKQSRCAFQGKSVAQVPPLGNRHAALDDTVFHLSHQFCHHCQAAGGTLRPSSDHDYGGPRCGRILCWARFWVADAHAPGSHQVLCPIAFYFGLCCTGSPHCAHGATGFGLDRHGHGGGGALPQHHRQHQGWARLGHHSHAIALGCIISGAICVATHRHAIVEGSIRCWRHRQPLQGGNHYQRGVPCSGVGHPPLSKPSTRVSCGIPH